MLAVGICTIMNRSFLFTFQARASGLRALAITLVVTSAAMLIGILDASLINSTPFMPAACAVILSAWFGGLRHGALSAAMSSLFVNYYLLGGTAVSLGGWNLRRTLVWFAFACGLSYLLNRLRNNQDQARRVMAGIAEGFLILDRDWNVVYSNDAAAASVGKSGPDMIGGNYWELVPRVVGTPIEQQLRRCASEGVPVQFESRCPHSGRWVQFRAYPSPGEISIFLQDMSEAKEREDKLRASLERLSTAHRAAQMGTFEWDARTNEIVWSEDTFRIHGVTREQFDGRFETWLKSIHPEDLTSVLGKIQKALHEKNEYAAEYRVVWPNGEIRWCGGHGQVTLDDGGDVSGIVAVCSDITHRRLEEEALRRSEKLAAAGRLAATIAHEINNPLEAVTNLVYLMRQDRGVKPDTQDLLRLADEQLARVNHIAKQTLGFYQDRNVPESLDVVQTLEGLLTILQSRINAKQIRVEREYDNACLLSGFRGELRQVFSNLLTNAIDASYGGGKLILRVRPARNGNQIDSVCIEVEDFGSGIQPHDRPRIFEPFFTTKSDIGTGLGLWVTKGLVERNGGVISFRSSCHEADSGTCFSVTLPATLGVPSQAQAAS
jgi:PAS domain S-box-containing protein